MEPHRGLLGPWARTSSTSGRVQNARAASSGRAEIARISRSPTVSFPRRREPAGSTRTKARWPRASDKGGGPGKGIAQKLALFRAARLLKPPQDLLLNLGAQPLDLPDLSLPGHPLQILQGAHAQGLVEELHGLGAYPLHLR